MNATCREYFDRLQHEREPSGIRQWVDIRLIATLADWVAGAAAGHRSPDRSALCRKLAIQTGPAAGGGRGFIKLPICVFHLRWRADDYGMRRDRARFRIWPERRAIKHTTRSCRAPHTAACGYAAARLPRKGPRHADMPGHFRELLVARSLTRGNAGQSRSFERARYRPQ